MDIQLTTQEKFLIKICRELKPFERVEVMKDASGKPNRFLVQRSQKIMVTEIKIEAVA